MGGILSDFVCSSFGICLIFVAVVQDASPCNIGYGSIHQFIHIINLNSVLTLSLHVFSNMSTWDTIYIFFKSKVCSSILSLVHCICSTFFNMLLGVVSWEIGPCYIGTELFLYMYIWLHNICLCNSLLSEGTMPFHESMLTFQRRNSVVFIRDQIYKNRSWA